MIAHDARETQTEVEFDQAQPTICRGRGHRDGAANPSASPGTGISQKELAGHLGLSFQQVQKYEKGINRVGAALLQQIAEVLGVDIPFFYDGDGKEPDVDSLLVLNSVFSLRLLRALRAYTPPSKIKRCGDSL